MRHPRREGGRRQLRPPRLLSNYARRRHASAAKDSKVRADHFGRDFLPVFLEQRSVERDKFFAYVTPLEYEWYLRTA